MESILAGVLLITTIVLYIKAAITQVKTNERISKVNKEIIKNRPKSKWQQRLEEVAKERGYNIKE